MMLKNKHFNQDCCLGYSNHRVGYDARGFVNSSSISKLSESRDWTTGKCLASLLVPASANMVSSVSQKPLNIRVGISNITDSDVVLMPAIMYEMFPGLSTVLVS